MQPSPCHYSKNATSGGSGGLAAARGDTDRAEADDQHRPGAGLGNSTTGAVDVSQFVGAKLQTTNLSSTLYD